MKAPIHHGKVMELIDTRAIDTTAGFGPNMRIEYTYVYQCNKCGLIKKISEEKLSGPCFIATAAYGTPFAKDINVLRKWRDMSLMTNPFGKFFVSLYYKTSPPIAFLVSKSEELKKIVRCMLKPFIKYLRIKNRR